MQQDALFAISNGLYVLSAKDQNRYVGSLVDAVSQVAIQPNLLVISCMNNSYTKEVILKTGECALSVLPADVNPFVVANFGFQSSKTVDKWKLVQGLEINGNMYIPQSLAKVALKVTDKHIYKSHTLFIAEVKEAFDYRNDEPLTYKMYRDEFKNKVMEAFEKYRKTGQVPSEINNQPKGEKTMEEKKWTCIVCGYVYDGDVPFEDLPEDWVCPLCGVGKDQFELR